DTGQFYWMETAYNVRSVEMLLKSGNITQASLVLRSMIDAFVVYRFYMNRKDGNGYYKFIMRESSRSWKDLYDDLSPEFYDNQYALLSKSVHSDPITNHVLRYNGPDGIRQTYTSEEISLDFYVAVFNKLIHLYKGIVLLFHDLFPDNTLSDYYIQMEQELLDFINDDIEYRSKKYQEQKPMIKQYNELIKNFKAQGIDW
ncbi:MAG: hypothetical protein ACOCQD_05395, partial [archaeon]